MKVLHDVKVRTGLDNRYLVSFCIISSIACKSTIISKFKHLIENTFNSVDQRFSTGVPQEFLKHIISDYSVRGLTPFSFRLSKKKKKDSSQPKNGHLV